MACSKSTGNASITRESEVWIAEDPDHMSTSTASASSGLRDTLPGGWLVATNLNNVLKKTIIRLAAEVAGVKFGQDVVVEF